MNEVIKKLNDDKNIIVFSEHSFLSIYDDNFYDRSDFDAINSAQKKYLEACLNEFDYKWSSGRVLESALKPIKFLCPKPKTLMTSPYDILDFESLQHDSIYVLTPTQVLGQLLKHELNQNELLKKATALITKTPANLLKLKDGLRGEALKKFDLILPELSKHQKIVTQSPKFKTKRQLGSIF